MHKIIIVDDYTDLQDFFKSLLEMNGFEVKSAGSLSELNALLSSFIPDLILLDVMLGPDSGREICRELKKKHKQIHIILISANPKSLDEYKECGADDIIEKPFTITVVLDKIKSLLAKNSS